MYSKTHNYIQPSSIWRFFQNSVAKPFINGGYIFFALFLSTSIIGSFFLSSFLMSSEAQFFLSIKYCLNHKISFPTSPLIDCDITNHPKICGGKPIQFFMLMVFGQDYVPQCLSPQLRELKWLVVWITWSFLHSYVSYLSWGDTDIGLTEISARVHAYGISVSTGFHERMTQVKVSRFWVFQENKAEPVQSSDSASFLTYSVCQNNHKSS